METKRKSPTKITSELITKLKELVESGMKNVDICKELEAPHLHHVRKSIILNI